MSNIQSDPSLLVYLGRILQRLQIQKDPRLNIYKMEDIIEAFVNFLEDPVSTRLFMHIQDREVVFGHVLPSTNKAVYFIKLKNSSMKTLTEAQDFILCGDIGTHFLAHIAALTDELILPILSSSDLKLPDASKNALFKDASLYSSVLESESKHAEDAANIDGPLGSSLPDLEAVACNWTIVIRNAIAQTDDCKQKRPDVKTGGKLVSTALIGCDWETRATRLTNIQNKLSDLSLHEIVRNLEAQASSCTQSLQIEAAKLSDEVLKAREMARFFKPLLPVLEAMLSADEDLAMLSTFFQPLLHILFLSWKHCVGFRSLKQLSDIIRSVSFVILTSAQQLLQTAFADCFLTEPQQALDSMHEVLQTITYFKGVFICYRDRASTECSEKPWDLHVPTIFCELDNFLEQCHQIFLVCKAKIAFSRLEKVEIGGISGGVLSSYAKEWNEEFNETLKEVWGKTAEAFDIINLIDCDHSIFKRLLVQMQQRLRYLVVAALNECSTANSMLMFFESIEGVLKGTFIHEEFLSCQNQLLAAVLSHLQDAPHVLQVGPVPIKGIKPLTSKVSWAHALLRRITFPEERFKILFASGLQSSHAKHVRLIYSGLQENVKAFEIEALNTWNQRAIGLSEQSLSTPVFSLEGGNPVVNFDVNFLQLMCEVDGLLLLQPLAVPIPQSVLLLHKDSNFLRSTISVLGWATTAYTSTKACTVMEATLLKGTFAVADQAIRGSLKKNLTWNDKELATEASHVSNSVQALSNALLAVKKVTASIRDLVSNWKYWQFPSSEGIFGSQEALLRMFKEKKVSLQGDINRISGWLSRLYNDLSESPTSVAWQTLLGHVNFEIGQNLSQAVVAAIQTLISHTSETAWLEAKIELGSGFLKWNPELGDFAAQLLDPNSVCGIVACLLASVFDVVKDLPQLANPSMNYYSTVKQNPDVCKAMSDCSSKLKQSLNCCQQTAARLHTYSILWIRDHQFIEGPLVVANKPGESDICQAELTNSRLLQQEIQNLPSKFHFGWLSVDISPWKSAAIAAASKRSFAIADFLRNQLVWSINEKYEIIADCLATLDSTNGQTGQSPTQKRVHCELLDSKPTRLRNSINKSMGKRNSSSSAAHLSLLDLTATKQKEIYDVLRCIKNVLNMDLLSSLAPLNEATNMLYKFGFELDEITKLRILEAPMKIKGLESKIYQKRDALAPICAEETLELKHRTEQFKSYVDAYRLFFLKTAPFTLSEGDILTHYSVVQANQVLEALENVGVDGMASLVDIANAARDLHFQQALLDLTVFDCSTISACQEDLKNLGMLWAHVAYFLQAIDDWGHLCWWNADIEAVEEDLKNIYKRAKIIARGLLSCQICTLLDLMIKEIQDSLPIVRSLRSPFIFARHWGMIVVITGVNFHGEPHERLSHFFDMKLHKYNEEILDIIERAQKEFSIERALKKIEENWGNIHVKFDVPLAPAGELSHMAVPLIVLDDTLKETLENDAIAIQILSASRYVQGYSPFAEAANSWQRHLSRMEAILTIWIDVQKRWSAMQAIFSGSEDVRKQLVLESACFDAVDADFKELMIAAPAVTSFFDICSVEGRLERLQWQLGELESCEKALLGYLELKRMEFPRFYFLSPADLLDLLARGADPHAVAGHLRKNFDNLHLLEWGSKSNCYRNIATGMYSGEGEYVPFVTSCLCEGPAEAWLARVLDCMKEALRMEYKSAILLYEDPRAKWLLQHSSQSSIIASRTHFTYQVEQAFANLEDGNDDGLAILLEMQKQQLCDLIQVINGELSPNDRKKAIALCTVDVHARDVVQRLINEQADSANSFQWQCQLRYYQDEVTGDCRAAICDVEFEYQYEFIGNCGCLCITPLTDRCYITLTQAHKLILGGAPAGPAGTGKTETTKDLARAFGILCYVFNCSEQMDYKALAQIYKGLAQTGAWGCFDEFNRIPVPVLSVCTSQYKVVLDGLRARKARFIFEGQEISLQKSAMAFITMNPGYAGRSELPESLKALFRPVSMSAPDLKLICEIMLMAEGFQESNLLARKFVILYKLCEDLLSRSKHYDWKLRAIKTTLYVAGEMKRAAPELSEDQVLVRALRDFNMGKLVQDDVPVFLGLLNDLFPGALEHVPRAVNVPFEGAIKEAALELGYQPELQFCLRVSQLREIFAVRWSVFLLGPAGAGKTAVWKTLARAQEKMGEPTAVAVINPKALNRNELYGCLHRTTREWKDGVIAQTFREFASCKDFKHQWIVLDGDIDPEWIESMNTVMDDNKVLTLASNERIPLTPTMRLLLEIDNMNQCSPATVTRGGVIHMNADDVGWKPLVDSWLASLCCPRDVCSLLDSLFSKYLQASLDFVRRNCRCVIALPTVNIIQTMCKLLESLLIFKGNDRVEKLQQAPEKKSIEPYFVFACIWSVGGCIVYEHKPSFSLWWLSTFRPSFFPSEADLNVYDYYVDKESFAMVPWPKDCFGEIITGRDFNDFFVPTVHNAAVRYILDLLMSVGSHIMLVGGAGVGKSAMLNQLIKSLDPQSSVHSVVHVNSQYDANKLQELLESHLEKKAGSRYGASGNRNFICFLEGLNMSYLDKYQTQSAIELIRQSMDSGGWYGKSKVSFKQVQGVQYLATLNPHSGSFNISPRAQWQFATFALHMPTPEDLKDIFKRIVSHHFSSFDEVLRSLMSVFIDASVDLHFEVVGAFQLSAIDYLYHYNMKELSAVTRGLCRADPTVAKTPFHLARLWLHECRRVYMDRMPLERDKLRFMELCNVICRKHIHFIFTDSSPLETEPLIFCDFIQHATSAGREDEQVRLKVYQEVGGYNSLSAALNQFCSNSIDAFGSDLILFPDAMEHITRIARALPSDHLLLIGPGGSGRQTLASFSAKLMGYDVCRLNAAANYGMPEFKLDLLSLYHRAAVKDLPTVFLVSDSEITDERMLDPLNDLLATCHHEGLCNPEEKDAFCLAIRPMAKAAGVLDNAAQLWEYFIEQLKRNLRIVFCASPVGDRLRIWARKYPALLSSVTIDQFGKWPPSTLSSVAMKLLMGTSPYLVQRVSVEAVSQAIAAAHEAVVAASAKMLSMFNKHVYVTPNSFLEAVALFKELIVKRGAEFDAAKDRLQTGVLKMYDAQNRVEQLQALLQKELLVVEEQKAKAASLIESLGVQKALADNAIEEARQDEQAAVVLQQEVAAFQAECAADLAKAEPIIAEAEAALNSLDKASLGELKSFSNPANDIVEVVGACMILTSLDGRVRDLSWAAAKRWMGDINGLLKSLLAFDKETIPSTAVERVEKEFISLAGFSPELVRMKSAAAAGLCAWAINMCKYARIYEVVAPKRFALQEANKRLDDAGAKVAAARSHVTGLLKNLATLQSELDSAIASKDLATRQAEKTESKVRLADRLISGLADEYKRWKISINDIVKKESCIVGDALLTAVFVSYAGAFNSLLREDLFERAWLPAILKHNIPVSVDASALDLIATSGNLAKWAAEGLPLDSHSLENAAVVCSTRRFPLLIDPQLQGATWVTARESQHGLLTTRLSNPKYMDVVIEAVGSGVPLLIENLPEHIDPALDPLLLQHFVKKGSSLYVTLSGREVLFNRNFKLYLQTQLSLPHFGPEVAAKVTIIDFCVTEKGLEEQLLASVVNHEQPDLQREATTISHQLNQYAITILDLENNLLACLAASQGDILADESFVLGLEETKRAALEVEKRAHQAKATSVSLNIAREVYRPVAARGAAIYLLFDSLPLLDRVYRFSMSSFMKTLSRGLHFAQNDPASDKVDEKSRVAALVNSVTYMAFQDISRGLFEQHKLVVAVQLCAVALRSAGEFSSLKWEFLVKGMAAPFQNSTIAPPDWMTESSWSAIISLSLIPGFENLPAEISYGSKKWKEWALCSTPEIISPPGDWKRATDLDRLLLVRALRPEKLINALSNFATCVLGPGYVASQTSTLEDSLKHASATVPILLFLSPGVDVACLVEQSAQSNGVIEGEYVAISMGQGQESLAIAAMEKARAKGGWVLLQNVHLTMSWTHGPLEHFVELLDSKDTPHPNFRLFISAEPPPLLEKPLPSYLLQACVKLANEPPRGLKANLLRALSALEEDILEQSSRPSELKVIVFALCFFHAVIIERKRFGVGNRQGARSGLGWCMDYPFSLGDLKCCAAIASNILEATSAGELIPWEDMRYMFGEIIYGGHVVEAWDRRLLNAHLHDIFTDKLLAPRVDLCPGVSFPPAGFNFHAAAEHIQQCKLSDIPATFGLHQNAELGRQIVEARSICDNLGLLLPNYDNAMDIDRDDAFKNTDKSSVGGQSSKYQGLVDDVLQRLPDSINLDHVKAGVNDIGPFTGVLLQEAQKLNFLLLLIRGDLYELDLASKGKLTLSEPIEQLASCLINDVVPVSWLAAATPSLRGLSSWLACLCDKASQLADWAFADPSQPPLTIWLGGLFNPSAFLTAVQQTAARRNGWALDQTTIVTEVTKKAVEHLEDIPKDGAYIRGLWLEGARWDARAGHLEDATPGQLVCQLPIVLLRAVSVEKAGENDAYECPVYTTQARFRQEIFVAHLKSKASWAKWTRAGVCILLDV